MLFDIQEWGLAYSRLGQIRQIARRVINIDSFNMFFKTHQEKAKL